MNAVERALIVARSDVIAPADLPLQRGAEQPPAPPPRSLAEIEQVTILATLERNHGDRQKTAAELGISLRTLQYRLKEYGMTSR
jgi:two-component system NtrC family response regulator